MWLDRFSAPPVPAEAEQPGSFSSRAKRFPLDVPICFVEDGHRYDGQCINVSDSGLLACFRTPPELWTAGKIEMEAGEHYLDVHARVARLEDNDVGFAFQPNTDRDPAAIAVLVAAVRGVSP